MLKHIRVNVVSSNFNSLPFVLTVGVTHKISDAKVSYSKLSKNVPLDII